MCDAKMSGLIRERIVSEGTCAALTDRRAAEHPDQDILAYLVRVFFCTGPCRGRIKNI